jgi:hypothetical protein
VALARRVASGAAGLVKQIGVEDHVIGRDGEHNRVGVAASGERRSGRDRGTGIPPHRLEHDGGVDADLLGLAAREEAERVARHDDRRPEQIARRHPHQRLLVGRLLADQRQELLRHGVARHRPQARAGAAGENQRHDAGRGHQDAGVRR